jgi:hypothetical protein
MENMEKIFIQAGKDTRAFLEEAQRNGRKAFRSVKTQGESNKEYEIFWNKSSPISTKNFLVKSQSSSAKISEALLYFDEEELSRNMKTMTISECSKVLDEENAGFQYLSLSLLERFKKQKGSEKAKIIFLIRKNYSLVSLSREGLDKTSASLPHISAAAASFMAFAENLAAMNLECDFADFFLVLADCEEQEFREDSALARWIFQYLGEYCERGKNMSKTIQWIKPGAHISRSGRGFSLFGR